MVSLGNLRCLNLLSLTIMALSKSVKENQMIYIVEKDEEHSNPARQVYRANFQSDSDVYSWLRQFEKETKTNWIVKESFKGLQR